MTEPQDSPQVFEGTDIRIEAGDLEPEDHTQDKPATTDPAELSDDGSSGGVGGQGGAG